MKCLKTPHHPWSSPSSCWLYIKCWSNRIHEIVFLLCRSGGTLLIWKIMAPFVSTSGILKESRSDLAMIWFGCKTFLVLIRLRRRRQQWWCCCPIKKHSFSAYLAVLCLWRICVLQTGIIESSTLLQTSPLMVPAWNHAHSGIKWHFYNHPDSY